MFKKIYIKSILFEHIGTVLNYFGLHTLQANASNDKQTPNAQLLYVPGSHPESCFTLSAMGDFWTRISKCSEMG